MAVTWFFEGIDCGSDAVLKFRVSRFQQMIRYPDVRALCVSSRIIVRVQWSRRTSDCLHPVVSELPNAN